jgi:hypothetical protein
MAAFKKNAGCGGNMKEQCSTWQVIAPREAGWEK